MFPKNLNCLYSIWTPKVCDSDRGQKTKNYKKHTSHPIFCQGLILWTFLSGSVWLILKLYMDQRRKKEPIGASFSWATTGFVFTCLLLLYSLAKCLSQCCKWQMANLSMYHLLMDSTFTYARMYACMYICLVQHWLHQKNDLLFLLYCKLLLYKSQKVLVN